MKKQFNLSDKRYKGQFLLKDLGEFVFVEDVKEFIKELKETFSPKPRSFLTEIGSKEICNRIDKLAGKDLI